MGRIAACAGSLLALSCGAAEPAATRVEGSLPAFELSVRDAIFVTAPLPGGGQGVFIHLTDQAGACELAREHRIQFELAETRQGRAGSRFLTWTVHNPDRGRPLGPGPVPFAFPALDASARGGLFGFPLVAVSGDQCQTHEIAYDPSRVRLELSKFEPRPGGLAEGTFEIGRRDHRLSGRFSARYCELEGLRAQELACSR